MTERLHFHFSLSCIGEGNGNPLQRSCLENPRDGGAWWAAVYGVAQSRTRLKRLSSSSMGLWVEACNQPKVHSARKEPGKKYVFNPADAPHWKTQPEVRRLPPIRLLSPEKDGGEQKQRLSEKHKTSNRLSVLSCNVHMVACVPFKILCTRQNVYICITESFCYTAEIGKTLKINYFSIENRMLCA